MISFIKMYPALCTSDEAGNILVRNDQPSAEIHYSGLIVDGHLEGEWEISAIYITEEGRPMEYVCMGTWTLYKE